VGSLSTKTRYDPGERFEFDLVLIGRALDFLPYFVLSFRELAAEGLGLNRARCTLERVEQIELGDRSQVTGDREKEEAKQGLRARDAGLGNSTKNPKSELENSEAPSPQNVILSTSPVILSEAKNLGSPAGVDSAKHPGGIGFPVPCSLFPVPCNPSPVTSLVYSAQDQLFRTPKAALAGDYVCVRLRELALTPETRHLTPALPTPDTRQPTPALLTVRFLTPTLLRADGKVIHRPEFHHLFKRVRDRINSLSTFFGDGPLDADFRGLGERAEKVRTLSSKIEWVERFRTSSKTHQRHELSGFVGECTFELPERDSEICNLELLEWLICGELLHAGKHAAWGNGWYEVRKGGLGGGQSRSHFPNEEATEKLSRVE
jgi:CRISPR/Cas system endoribonuclease Cas6 (RAMP superfamily)